MTTVAESAMETETAETGAVPARQAIAEAAAEVEAAGAESMR